MSDRIAEEKINEIRQASDIVDVISEYVQLKKARPKLFRALPFSWGEHTIIFSFSR